MPPPAMATLMAFGLEESVVEVLVIEVVVESPLTVLGLEAVVVSAVVVMVVEVIYELKVVRVNERGQR